MTSLDKDLTEAQGGKTVQRAALFQDFGRRREHYARLVGAVAAVIPREIQIDEFKFSEPVAAGPSGGPIRVGEDSRRPDRSRWRRRLKERSWASPASSSPSRPRARRTRNRPRLQKDLPEELAKAVVYPDKIGAIKTDDKGHFAISVGEIRLTAAEAYTTDADQRRHPLRPALKRAESP